MKTLLTILFGLIVMVAISVLSGWYVPKDKSMVRILTEKHGGNECGTSYHSVQARP